MYTHYLDSNGSTKPFEEKYLKASFPKAYEYLLNFKDYLTEKKISYKTNPDYWYSLHRARDIPLFEQENCDALKPEMTIDNSCIA